MDERSVEQVGDDDDGLSRRRVLGLGAAAAGLAVIGTGVTAAPALGATRRPVAKPPVIGIMEIPKIAVAMTMVQGTQKAALDMGPSHWPGTPLPGQPGNAVFMGHRVSKHKVFRNIDRLVAGDKLLFYVSVFNINTTFEYEVTGAYLAHPRKDAARVLAQTPEYTCTLFACHPPGSVRQRYVVTGKLLSNPM